MRGLRIARAHTHTHTPKPLIAPCKVDLRVALGATGQIALAFRERTYDKNLFDKHGLLRRPGEQRVGPEQLPLNTAPSINDGACGAMGFDP